MSTYSFIYSTDRHENLDLVAKFAMLVERDVYLGTAPEFSDEAIYVLRILVTKLFGENPDLEVAQAIADYLSPERSFLWDQVCLPIKQFSKHYRPLLLAALEREAKDNYEYARKLNNPQGGSPRPPSSPSRA